MKDCDLCGLDYQCCFHNKSDFLQLIRDISANCASRKDSWNACNCTKPKKEAQRQRYREILNNLPPEVKIRMPRLSELSDIYRDFITQNPSFK